MRSATTRFSTFAISLVAIALTGTLPIAQADDTEIFLSPASTNGNANILLILDSSGSMEQTASEDVAPYDSTYSYSNSNTNSCSDSYIYYTTSSTEPTNCSTTATGGVQGRIPTGNNKCAASRTATGYGTGISGKPGYYTDRFIRWGGSGSSRTWSPSMSVTSGTDVECYGDRGNDGDLSTSNPYPRSGTANQSNGRWGTSAQTWWTATNVGTQYWFWSPNYIRHKKNPVMINQVSRMSKLKAAASSFVQSASNVNIGLMRYANNNNLANNEAAAEGGVVLEPIGTLTDAKRAALIAAINGIHAGGYTPLSETLYEAHLYLSGGNVYYGRTALQNPTNPPRACSTNYVDTNGNGQCAAADNVVTPSVASSRLGGLPQAASYRSPIGEACQENFIIYLTDGLPTQDNSADTLITGLGATCTAGTADGRCLAGLASYMNGRDYFGTSGDGTQNVRTFFIGFGDEFEGGLTAAFDYLNTAAIAGGTQRAYQASSLPDLTAVFNKILNDINEDSTTFTAPTVAVNAFNRTQNLDDIYVSVFKPSSEYHWPGNVKKYKFKSGEIEDANNQAAVDTNTGFFKTASQSYWSVDTDGANVEKGGAASKMPEPSSRNLYTFIGSNPASPTAISGYPITDINTSVTDTMLGLTGAPGDPTRSNLISFVRGTDVTDVDDDSSTTRTYTMGASIHAQPSVVIYGGTRTTPNVDDAVIYQPTNDGFLHALNVGTETPVTDGGNELWAFVPQEQLPNLVKLYKNDPAASYQYALDGEVRVLKYDVNGDGIIDPTQNDRVFLFFGQARGGSNYYALDVTYKNNPKFMWKMGPSQLPSVGNTWSTPTITRMKISGVTQNSQKLVLVFGGGYNPAEDDTNFLPEDNVGNRVFIVDALYGTLLWSAGPEGSGANLELTRMTHSIPSRITTMDLDSDGYVDRMYVGDIAAQIWRFDIVNVDNPATTTVVENDRAHIITGGVLASLGTLEDATPVVSRMRRFYNPVDAVITRIWPNQPFINLAIGSGHRGHPLSLQTHDRFYSIRDKRPFVRMTQAEFDDEDRAIITDSDDDLIDVVAENSNVPATAKGWKLKLQDGSSWLGEKILGAATTLDSKVFFASYLPNQGSTTACIAPTGSNRAYAVDLLTGAPIATNRSTPLSQGGIAPEVTTIFCPSCMKKPGDSDGDGIPDKDDKDDQPKPGACLVGVEVFNVCTLPNGLRKTYWHELNLN